MILGVSAYARKGPSIVRLVESKNSGEVRNCDKIFKEHIHIGGFTSFCSMLFVGVKSKNKKDEDGVFVLHHGTVVSTDGIKLRTALRFAAVANGGGGSAWGKGFRMEDSVLVKVEVFVQDVISKVAKDPGFDGVGRCTSFVGGGGKDSKALWMGKSEFLCLEVGGEDLAF